MSLTKSAVVLFSLSLLSCTALLKTDYPGQTPTEDVVPAPGSLAREFDPVIYKPLPDTLTFVNEQLIQFVIIGRSSREIERTIRGALLYLDDTQIRDRPGLHASLYDYCQTEVKTCQGVILINKDDGSGYEQRVGRSKDIPSRNVVGEWANTIHFLPEKLGDAEGESKLAIQDSNVFTTAGILYPLYFIDEQLLPEEERIVEKLRSLAAASMAQYKRGDAYNFWIEMPGETSSAPKTGPFNIPVKLSRRVGELVSGRFHRFWQRYTTGLDVGGEHWVKQVLNKKENPYGFDAVFNIPNDADDTATVVATQKFHSAFQPQEGITPDFAALKVITQFRDVGRTNWDKRDVWRGNEDSGAFLTFFKDEDLETFSAPEQGILPRGVNNVDCVVNANALFALALNDAHTWAGFEDAKNLLVNTVNTRAWTGKCGLYYPQLMMLPYTLTRAYREGRLFDDPVMQQTMGVLLRDLLAMQQEDGSFPGGGDKTGHLATALATNSLINIGFEIAQKHNLSQDYQAAIAKAIKFLVTEKRHHRLMFSDFDDRPEESQAAHYAFMWDSGLFFSGTFWDLAQWRSEAYTTAIVLEALVKFVLAFDLDNSTLLKGRRLRVESYEALGGKKGETAR